MAPKRSATRLLVLGLMAAALSAHGKALSTGQVIERQQNAPVAVEIEAMKVKNVLSSHASADDPASLKSIVMVKAKVLKVERGPGLKPGDVIYFNYTYQPGVRPVTPVLVAGRRYPAFLAPDGGKHKYKPAASYGSFQRFSPNPQPPSTNTP